MTGNTLKIVFSTTLLFLVAFSFSATSDSTLFSVLDEVIANKQHYEIIKQQEIAKIKSRLKKGSSENFKALENLHDAYFTFNYDSSMTYALRMLDIAYLKNDEYIISRAKVKISESLLASGIFNEVKDTLTSININFLDDSIKLDYYYVSARLYFDMADYYQREYYSDYYSNLGLLYLDTAINYAQKNLAKRLSFEGLKQVRTGNMSVAATIFDSLFQINETKGRQYAIDAATYAFVLENSNQADVAINWLIKAAIQDIKLANKENVALTKLADLLYNQGNIAKSSEYLNFAIEDATSYGAVQRKFQIGQIQPIIEAAKLQLSEEQKHRIENYALSLTILSILIIIILVILFMQYKKTRAAKNELNKSYAALHETNTKLREANLITEEYIAKFFKTNSALIDKMENLKHTVEGKVLLKKFSELKVYLNNIDINKQREEMYELFDSVFLNIFPGFVDGFNDLFDEDDKLIIGDKKVMNTNLRIFALIRLGINDTEKIAHILDYSVNTINTYKTKIKNKSKVENEKFEEEILKIPSI